MTVQAADDAAGVDAASWLLSTGAEWWHLVRFGHPHFEVHARIAFDPAPDSRANHTRTALAVLGSFTSTPHVAYSAIWQGWGGGGSVPRAPRVEIPHRSMVLLTGPVAALRDAAAVAWGEDRIDVGAPPHLAWPADRAWCFACEVDEDVGSPWGAPRRRTPRWRSHCRVRYAEPPTARMLRSTATRSSG